MSRSVRTSRPARQPAEGVEEQIERIGVMSIGELRRLWQQSHGGEPPAAFSKDLLARAIAHRLQEEAYGGLSGATTRLLKSLIRPGAEPPRRVKVGSVIVREHKGVLHEVVVVSGGFCWQGETYDSLSTIARRITGVSWNGPRFFGLRSRKNAETGAESSAATNAQAASNGSALSSRRTGKSVSQKEVAAAGRAGRRSSIRTGGGQ